MKVALIEHQVCGMHRTLKKATMRQPYYQIHPHLKAHLHAFQMADNFATRLKTLRGFTPYKYICHCWPKEPEGFTISPYHHTLGLNT